MPPTVRLVLPLLPLPLVSCLVNKSVAGHETWAHNSVTRVLASGNSRRSLSVGTNRRWVSRAHNAQIMDGLIPGTF